jgi:hypothetical protein
VILKGLVLVRRILPGLLILSGLLATQSGCATARPYFSDRWNDAKDVTTLTLGVGVGAKARVGPIWTGLLVNWDKVGLRYGCAGYWPNYQEFIYEMDFFCYGCDSFGPSVPYGEPERRCDYLGSGFIPFCAFPARGCQWIQPVRPDTLKYYGQIEAVVGLGPSVRVGFNPVELVDFLCGWFTVDFCRDDVGLPRKHKD